MKRHCSAKPRFIWRNCSAKLRFIWRNCSAQLRFIWRNCSARYLSPIKNAIGVETRSRVRVGSDDSESSGESDVESSEDEVNVIDV